MYSVYACMDVCIGHTIQAQNSELTVVEIGAGYQEIVGSLDWDKHVPRVHHPGDGVHKEHRDQVEYICVQ